MVVGTTTTRATPTASPPDSASPFPNEDQVTANARRTQVKEAEGGAVPAAPAPVPTRRNFSSREEPWRCPTLEEAFSLRNLVASAKKCRRGVGWKRSVQSFHLNLVANCLDVQARVLDGTWRPKPGRKFRIHERGKPRTITACSYPDRVVQRTLCDCILLPALQRELIFDNGACIPGKGTSFALDRLEFHLQQHWERYGMRGGMMLFDFSKYFDRIRVGTSLQQFHELLGDRRAEQLLALCLGQGAKGGGCGLELGSQVSQLAAVLYPSGVDHWLVDECGVRGYGRYMDDGYVLWPDWDDLWHLGRAFEERCTCLGIAMNPKKFRFVRIGEEITFLKTRFRLHADGHVERRLPAAVLRQHKRRVRRLQGLVERGVMSLEDLACSEASWEGVLKRTKSPASP